MEMLLVALLIFSNLAAPPEQGPLPAAELDALRIQLTIELNRDRAAYGLGQLGTDRIAQTAAQYQAEQMLAARRLEHVDSEGRLPMTRYADFGGKADYYGENVGFRSPAVLDEQLLWAVLVKLDQAMMAEIAPNDGHRRNILSENYNAVGIGIAVGPAGIFMAEDFSGFHAKPPDQQPTPAR
jgi:uncharacterized protein YkwD